MKCESIRFIFLVLLTILLCTCDKNKIDCVLTNGYEYKLWYITMSSENMPEFLYIDSEGLYYTLGFDSKSGFFHPTNEESSFNFSGNWEYDSDSTIYLNNKLYSIEEGCDTFTYEANTLWDISYPDPVYYNEYLQLLYLRSNNDSIILRDTKFPIDLTTPFSSDIEKEKEHYEKWRRKIRKSVVLVGKDYKLWHWGKEKRYSNNEYYFFDKYGKTCITSFDEMLWRFSNPYNAELIAAGEWYQNKDTIYYYGEPHKILNYNKKGDTIKLYNIQREYEQIMIDPNLPLKEK